MASGLTETPEVALDTYKRLFTEARDLTQTARTVAQKHRRYYDGKIDERLKTSLRRKRQPDFTINRVRPGVEGMVGVVEKGKSDPRAWPRTPEDQDASEVATDTLRYVADINRWQQNKLKVFRNICVEGTAAAITEVDDQLEVRIRRIRFEEFFYDPYSREPDFSDASYMGVAKWQYVDELIGAYPEQEAALRLICSNGDTGASDATWNDRPDDNSTMWTDPRRKRMLAVEMYKRERGQWMKCVFVGSLKLEEGVSPYEDNEGKPCNPIEAQSAYVDDENQRYGVVADMVGPQDEINVYRRRAAHHATFRQVQETDPVAAYADPEEVRREAAKPDGVIPPGYGIVPNDKFQLDIALLQEAKAEIERVGPNPALLARGAASSGRQDLIRQQAGLTELAHLFAGLDDLELRIYRQVWARIRQFWKAPKFIRVTDNENAVKFVQINEPVVVGERPVIDPVTGFTAYDPVTRQIRMEPVTEVRNNVAQMGVDIIVDSTPDTANVQQEQFQALVDLGPVFAQNGQPIPLKAIIQASSLPKKRELLEALEQEKPQGPPALSPEQQEMLRLEMADKAAGVDKTRAQAEQARATALKTTRDAQLAELNALRPAEPPQQGF
ncbi:MAG: hypothetical protein JHD15_07155 [Phenylobacterium sp.]|uniref:portal protein n=1 Tax=Phenylobacterium sp. TaxID=1871053 RepID=UPI001A2929A4|nr:hypothetical protein [Phenylobacterium sp.]MBJ7410131.1 hypothetical protein [Phenylobacterium sp.]